MIKPTIYIIGAGISGLVSALLLLQKGYKVKLYESTKQAGGRLRSFYDERLSCEIDNGNHLILEANRSTVNLINQLGLKKHYNQFPPTFNFFDVSNLNFFETNGLKLSSVPGISLIDYLKLLRLLTGFDKTVAEAFNSSGNLFKNYLDHISRSILNTDSHTASAKLLRNCLVKAALVKDGLRHYYPKTSWGEALIRPVISKITELGGEVYYNKSLKRLGFIESFVNEFIFSDGPLDLKTDDIVILATPATVTSNILDIKVPQKYNPILNVHFKISHKFEPKIFAMLNSIAEWAFIKPGMISTTTSAVSDEVLNIPEPELVDGIWRDICKYTGLEALNLPQYKVIVEKRATFSADETNNRLRPQSGTKYNNLYITGDYIKSKLPATIESAIQSAENTVFLIEQATKNPA